MYNLNKEQLEEIFDYFGDREVFFPKEEGDLFSSCPEKMLETFDLLYLLDGDVYWKLNSETPNLYDPKGTLIDGDRNKVYRFHLDHESDTIEQITSMSVDEFNKKIR